MTDKSLHEFVEEVSGESHLRVEHDFGDGFVRLRTSEAERRQAAQDIRSSEDILLELLRNSKDAHASHIYIAASREANNRVLTVIDDGDGIPLSMHKHVFEPRVTSKLDTSHMDAWGLHGRGMALYSISVNARSASVLSSDSGIGCAMQVVTDTMKLPEKKDQSSFPSFELADSGTVNVRGPKNLLRTSCEFALEARASCQVYIGSPAEIASSLFSYGTESLSAIDRIFCKDEAQLPVVKRLATASDPSDFARIGSTLGLSMSERTARRILDGQIGEAQSVIERIEIKTPGKQIRSKEVAHRSQRVHLERSEREYLASAALDAFSEIAERYYLETNVKPSVKTNPERIIISLPLVKKI